MEVLHSGKNEKISMNVVFVITPMKHMFSLSYVAYGIRPLRSLKRTGEEVRRGGVPGAPVGNVIS